MKSLKITETLSINIEETENPYSFSFHHLFQMAARINKKRSFLFVSNVLGKHLAVNPNVPLMIGYLLGIRMQEVLSGKEHPLTEQLVAAIKAGNDEQDIMEKMEQHPLETAEELTFIGFAETATALGHSVFAAFENGKYVHSTREVLDNPFIIFEEEHSHASRHYMYVDEDFFKGEGPVILVDDEVTTGNTCVNIIEQLHAACPWKKEFVLVSILDWRTSEEAYKELEKKLGIKITAVSLVRGHIGVEGSVECEPTELNNVKGTCNYHAHTLRLPHARPSYLSDTGRFGITSADQKATNERLREIGQALEGLRQGKKTLVLGTGEFMYLPMKLATYMGEEVLYHSTTRSPIHVMGEEDYLIKQKYSFISPENPSVTNYLYNIPVGEYEEIFVFVESAEEQEVQSLYEALQETRAKDIHFIFCREVSGIHATSIKTAQCV